MVTDDSNAASQLPLGVLAPEAGNGRAARPFIKWAGGKAQLLPKLTQRLPTKFKRYFEPFVGGAALFFHVAPQEAYLADTNPELVGCYKVVRDDVEALIRELGTHRYEEEYYYSVREWDRKDDFSSLPAVTRAARFIYLNKTCFNGLYRVNSKGHFNVPFGSYSNPTIVDADNLRECSRRLARAEIVVSDYASVTDEVEKGDFVYFDPPYAPLSVTSSFTAYTKQGFDYSDQEALREVCHRLDKKGVYFMLSNSSNPRMIELYRDFTVHTVSATRAINSKATDRGPVSEIIVTNY
jgi:DNA adenine methylase